MKVLINIQNAKFLDNIDCLYGFATSKEIITDKNLDIIVYNLKNYYRFLLNREISKIKKELDGAGNVDVYLDERVNDYIRDEFSKYLKNENCILKNLSEITKKISLSLHKENLDIGIISIKYDKAIFQIIDSIKDLTKTISIITHEDSFFEEATDYAWSKYGILTNLKDFSSMTNKDIAIILNKSHKNNMDFSKISKYTIDIYQKYIILKSNYLDDFWSFKPEKLSDFKIKMCNFVEKEQKILDLKWKFLKKS